MGGGEETTRLLVDTSEDKLLFGKINLLFFAFLGICRSHSESEYLQWNIGYWSDEGERYPGLVAVLQSP